MARADLCIHNARVVTPSGTIHGGVASTDGTITAVGGDASLPDADRTIDAEGNYLIPGFIDPHVHWGLSRYEFEYHEGLEHDFETETRGAVHGGVTTVVKVTTSPTRGLGGVKVKSTAVTFLRSARTLTSSGLTSVPLLPTLSVTVRVTVKVPGVL